MSFKLMNNFSHEIANELMSDPFYPLDIGCESCNCNNNGTLDGYCNEDTGMELLEALISILQNGPIFRTDFY